MRHPRGSRRSGRGTPLPTGRNVQPGVRCVQHIGTFGTARLKLVGLRALQAGGFPLSRNWKKRQFRLQLGKHACPGDARKERSLLSPVPGEGCGGSGPLPRQNFPQRPTSLQGHRGGHRGPAATAAALPATALPPGAHRDTLTRGTAQQRAGHPPATHARPCPDGPAWLWSRRALGSSVSGSRGPGLQVTGR